MPGMPKNLWEWWLGMALGAFFWVARYAWIPALVVLIYFVLFGVP